MDTFFELFKSVSSLAGDASTAVGSIAKTVETVKSLVKTSEGGTNADIKLAMSDLTVQIANAQVANSDLKLRLAALQDALAEAQQFKSDMDCYQLCETPMGAIVYRIREEAREGKPDHYLCPNCVESKRKSILQGHVGWRECKVCKTGFPFERDDTPTTVRTRRNIY